MKCRFVPVCVVVFSFCNTNWRCWMRSGRTSIHFSLASANRIFAGISSFILYLNSYGFWRLYNWCRLCGSDTVTEPSLLIFWAIVPLACCCWDMSFLFKSITIDWIAFLKISVWSALGAFRRGMPMLFCNNAIINTKLLNIRSVSSRLYLLTHCRC